MKWNNHCQVTHGGAKLPFLYSNWGQVVVSVSLLVAHCYCTHCGILPGMQHNSTEYCKMERLMNTNNCNKWCTSGFYWQWIFCMQHAHIIKGWYAKLIIVSAYISFKQKKNHHRAFLLEFYIKQLQCRKLLQFSNCFLTSIFIEMQF